MKSAFFFRRLLRPGLRALAGAAIVYSLVLLLVLLLENKLLYPAPKYPAGDWTCTYLPHEDVNFTSADGTRLHGWLVEHPQPRAVVLYCHGNGDCLGYLGRYLKELSDRQCVTVFAFDYRGYGRSEGSPHEAGILADAKAAQQWLAERVKIPPAEIVLIGRSLGGAVAVDLAAKSGARGLVLQSTTTTIPDVAARIMWYLPVRWLMHNRYDSLSKIASYMGPVLQSHGTADSLIPLHLGQKLFAAVPGAAKRMFLIEGGDHNDPEPPEYDAALEEFFQSLSSGASTLVSNR